MSSAEVIDKSVRKTCIESKLVRIMADMRDKEWMAEHGSEYYWQCPECLAWWIKDKVSICPCKLSERM